MERIIVEKERTMVSAGLVLTAGLEKSPTENRWIPDPEGRIRVKAALIDLRQGIIDTIFVCGGAEKDGLELGDYYYFYTKNLLRKTGQDQSRVAFLLGGYEPGSDLDWALDEIPDGTQLRIYTTSYQQGRVRLILKSLGREAILVNSERLVQPNSYSDARLVQQALDKTHVPKRRNNHKHSWVIRS